MNRILFICCLSLLSTLSYAQGIPVIQNFSAKEYQGNNLNFDIEIGTDGTIYVANFEGLLYYDKVDWHMIPMPGISRATVVLRDERNNIWVGGYNFFGKLLHKENGEPYLQQLGDPEHFRGEVEEIWEKNDSIFFLIDNTTKSVIYQVLNDTISVKKEIKEGGVNVGLSDIVDTNNLEEDGEIVLLSDVVVVDTLDDGNRAVVKKGKGLWITDEKDRTLYTITKANGLCSNDVIYTAYDGHGKLWGVSNEGIFSIAIPSAITHFTQMEGLMGEVLSIKEFQGRKYVGTLQGLFKQEGMSFVRVGKFNHACWKLTTCSKGLLAGTAYGTYLISAKGDVKQLSSANTMAVETLGSDILCGEPDGLYLRNTTGGDKGKKVCELEKIIYILKDDNGSIWLQNIYGDVWCKDADKKEFAPYFKNKAEDIAATIVLINGKVSVITTQDTEPFPYPLYSFTDPTGVTWLTDISGKNLYQWKKGEKLDELDKYLYTFRDKRIRTMFCKDNEVWIGCDDGLWIINKNIHDPLLEMKPRLRFRSIIEGGQNVLWGGYGEMPKSFPPLSSNERNLSFSYALDYVPLIGQTQYRYRLNKGEWSVWDDENMIDFPNLPYGRYQMDIQAQLATGELTEITSVKFSIAYPFYMRWYMQIVYFLLLVLVIYALIRFRLHRLNREKQRLEKVVKERTAKVVQQKDEIEEKSKSLEKALNELENAQSKLIRQEKMATVGKLTQGLIDRILNPLNYINNFTKLSQGLVKDVEDNIEDDKDKMDEENYEDTKEVLGMLTVNLKKVGEHGQNTSRTLKAMEEMLKDRSGGIVKTDLTAVIKNNKEMVATYFEKEIETYKINTIFEYPDTPVYINANPDQLSKTFMNLLGNSIYAVVKKASQTAFQPEVAFRLKVDADTVTITFRDNGVGIEQTIIKKIFDPFFTTKTTGEASGIGLYISHEIIQNYGGDIYVNSIKNEFTEFTITLPVLKQ